jgi:predicted nucleic acid-binding protein
MAALHKTEPRTSASGYLSSAVSSAAHNIAGKPAHDARLVAAMRAHGLTAILTFDPNVFARFPGIQVIVPQP